jgi:hypothetical protein
MCVIKNVHPLPLVSIPQNPSEESNKLGAFPKAPRV